MLLLALSLLIAAQFYMALTNETLCAEIAVCYNGHLILLRTRINLSNYRRGPRQEEGGWR